MMKSLDRLLRETLRERTAPNPATSCLDAETVAGWFDNTLGARDRTAAEAHVADCVRCQALLAAMVRTAPPAVAHPWRRASFIGWLVPVAAAATAMLVWVNLPERPIVLPAPANTRGAMQPAEPVQTRTENPSVEATVPPRADRDRLTSASNAEPGDALRKRAVRSTDARALDDSSLARTTPDAAPQAAPGSVVVSGPSQSLAETMRRGAPNPVATQMRRALREAPIVSTDSLTRWRIATGAEVERSTDGGVTWETQDTGVTVTLTAGASPSPSVCWLVGEDGVVLITIDGRSWQRLALPEVIDLAAVRATDDRTATVTAADGRSFTTSDRGQTWSVN